MSLTLPTNSKQVHAAQAEVLHPFRLARAKKAYTTRFLAAELELNAEGYFLSSGPDVVPRAGDVVLARVDAIGMHTRLESPESRRQTLFIGDEILVSYGNRYAPDQFLAEVPPSLQQCQLVAGGGVAGQVVAQHAAVLEATMITPLGLLSDASGPVNLDQCAPFTISRGKVLDRPRPPVIAVLGTSMNSGKTTTTACLVRGLTTAGLHVAAGKATGTGSGNDPRLFTDAGAYPVMDFTDFGQATTFQQGSEQTLDLLLSLIAALADSGPDAIVLEVADGLYQEETRRLLREPAFRDVVDKVVFCTLDALGAVAGARELASAGLPVDAVSGRLTASPLAMGEAAEVLNVPVLETFSLCEPGVASTLFPSRPGRN